MRRFMTLFVIVIVWQGASKAGVAAERDLKPGPFRPIPGAELGQPVNFENEIDMTRCYPLLVSGQVVSWLAGAHAFDKRLLVIRCEEYDPTIEQTRGNRHGGLNNWWEEARLSPDHRKLLTTRLKLPSWSAFSNPAFCGASVAYWGFRQAELIPITFDLRATAISASRSLGVVSLETDNTGFLPLPSWNPTCSEATFDGSAVKRPAIKLSSQPKPR
ncbi:MAG: hypothetical protein L0Z53_11510 [Acidobacteriales bacterium]|nr:hypothetical protein [Terriglobales bacterium]